MPVLQQKELSSVAVLDRVFEPARVRGLTSLINKTEWLLPLCSS
jgi:hypothetical protein